MTDKKLQTELSWLLYFNEVAHRSGLINEREKVLLNAKILESRKTRRKGSRTDTTIK